MNFTHTSNESHHLEGEIHQGGEKGQKAGEYLIHFHQKSKGKVNLGIDSSEFHFLLVPQCKSSIVCNKHGVMIKGGKVMVDNPAKLKFTNIETQLRVITMSGFP